MSDRNLEKYSEYNRILRSWFVAFGVGAPVLFLINNEVRDQIIVSGEMRTVVLLFLTGASVQVIITFINKVINWYLHHGNNNEFRKTKRYQWSETISNWFWLDISADIATFFVFGIAVWKVFTAFVE